ncbi:MAG: hypothetical protein QOI78_4852 [Actinomycetota bacterium]|nr:hypothetical protein [Actinomycetota bacterium]
MTSTALPVLIAAYAPERDDERLRGALRAMIGAPGPSRLRIPPTIGAKRCAEFFRPVTPSFRQTPTKCALAVA